MNQAMSKTPKHFGLLTNVTGVLDLLRVSNQQGLDWLLPSALVLGQERQNEPSDSPYIFHGTQQIPLYRGLLPKGWRAPVHVLVIEGEHDVGRLALLCNNRPQALRVSISSIRDVDGPVDQPYVVQAVEVNGSPCVVPDLDLLAQHLCL